MRHVLTVLAIAGMTTAATGQIKPEKPDIGPIERPTLTPKPGELSRPTGPTTVTPIAVPKPADPMARVDTGGINPPTVQSNIRLFSPRFEVMSVHVQPGNPSPVPRSVPLMPGPNGYVARVSGLNGMRTVHLLALDLGSQCRIGGPRQPGFGGNGIMIRSKTRNGVRVLSSGDTTVNDNWDTIQAQQGQATYRFTPPSRAGYTVPANGIVDFHIFGWQYVETKADDFDAGLASSGGGPDTPGAGWSNFTFGWSAPLGGGTEPTCVPRAIIAVQDQNDVWKIADAGGNWIDAREVRTPKLHEAINPLILRGYVRRTITDTWRMRDIIGAAMDKRHDLSLSQCSGKSKNFSGEFPVGMVNRGGRLAFVARSGQIATDCVVNIGPTRLPIGVRVVEMNFRLERIGDACRPGTNWGGDLTELARLAYLAGRERYDRIEYAVQLAKFGGYFVHDTRAFVVMPAEMIWFPGTDDRKTVKIEGASVHAIGNPYALPGYQRGEERFDMVRPLNLFLSCGMALSNDNEVAVVLDSMIVDVPDGVTL